MADKLQQQIIDIKTEANNLFEGASYVVRKSKGFPEAVETIKRTIDVLEKINGKIDAIQEAYFHDSSK